MPTQAPEASTLPASHPHTGLLGDSLSPTLLRLAVLLLGILSLPSLLLGLHRAFTDSRDLQWGGAYLLRHGIDPWSEAIHGYPHHLPIEISPPNYLHHLYVLLLPFSLLPRPAAAVAWGCLNVVLSIATVYLLRRLYELPPLYATALLFLLWMSSPFRVTMACGQMGLVELFCFTLAFSALSAPARGLAFGLSLAKYSFAPPTFLFFLLRRRLVLLTASLAVALAGLLAARAIVSTPILRLATEPLTLAGAKVWPGVADLMTLLEALLTPPLGLPSAQHVAYAVALLGSLAFALLLARFRLSHGEQLALLSLGSLFLFKHLIYDYVFLLPPLALAISAAGRRLRYPTLFGIALFWYAASLLNRSTNLDTGAVVLPRLALNVLLAAALLTWTTATLLRDRSTASRLDAA